MIVKRFSKGVVNSNTYVVGIEKECIIIDCGVESEEVIQYINEQKLNVKYIVLTHGHFDHMYFLGKYLACTMGLLCIHKEDALMLQDDRENGSFLVPGGGITIDRKIDVYLDEETELQIDNVTAKILHTPGHTQGGISLLIENKLFSGDTLFRMSIGRYDLPRGDGKQLRKSIINKILTLEDDVEIYPGHGSQSTVGFEKKNNPYLV